MSLPAPLPQPYASDRFHCPADLFHELSAHSAEFVFVLGCARSGTTIMADLLNQLSDVFVLYEDNPFLNVQRTDYADWYNAMHLADGRSPAKGVFLPSFGAHQPGWAYIYSQLKRSFARCGSKIALGPHGLWPDVEATLLDYFGSFFFHSRYILTLRPPADNVASMARMFQDKDILELIETWALSLLYTVRIAACFPHALLIRNELLDASYLARLAAFTSPPLHYDPELVRFQPAARGPDWATELGILEQTFPAAPPACRSVLEQAFQLHETVVTAFHRETGLLRDAVHRIEFSRHVSGRISRLREGIAAIRQ